MLPVNILTATINNATLKLGTVASGSVKSMYSNFSFEDFTNGDLTLTNSKLNATTGGKLNINSRYSIVMIDDIKELLITSVTDRYQLKQAGTITGKKDFGNLYIEELEKSLSVAGNNTHVSIDEISKNVALIKIDSKYAELKLPVKQLANYSVYYAGSNNDVNKITSVTSTSSSGSATATATASTSNTVSSTDNTQPFNTKIYQATAGNMDANYLQVNLTCNYCNVVLN